MPLVNGEKLIPQPFKGEMTITMRLPDELLTLMRDMHQDREAIGLGGLIIITCLVTCTLRHIFKKS